LNYFIFVVLFQKFEVYFKTLKKYLNLKMSHADLQAKGFGLSLSGLRVGPLDPKSKVPKVGSLQ
jgi:hypothetical protein